MQQQQVNAEQIIAAAKKWRCIYPAYLDSSLKMSQGTPLCQRLGRRLGLAHCVQYPTLEEISEVLQKLQLQHLIEGHKIYSKDVLKQGRIKVRILSDEGNILNAEIKNSTTDHISI
jgi:signal recognition particle subunit SRP19